MKGTVIKRGATWSVVVDAGTDPNGKRLRKWHSGFATKREAEQARVEILGRLAQGVYVSPSKVTVADWLPLWLEGRTSIAETTRNGYGVDVRRIVKELGPRRLQELSASLIQAWYTKLGEKYSAKTVKNTHGVLHKALSDAVRQGILVRNPADDLELPRADKPDTPAWTAEELSKFLKKVAPHRLYAAWVLTCSTGMRRSEVLGVRWQNLDLKRRLLAVVDTVVPVNNRPVLRIGETKSRRSRRVIALDEMTVTVLKEHRKRQNAERLRAGEAWEDLDLVFTNPLGGMVSPDWFTRTTKALAVEAGVRPLTPHPAGRHTWATLAMQSGVHVKVVSERLGHSSVAITLDRYSHVTEGMDREAAETVAALIK